MKRSAIIGAVRGFVLLAAIFALTYDGISTDVYMRGSVLSLDYRKVMSLASSADALLFYWQLAMLLPVGCVLGAVVGVAFDWVEKATTKSSLRLLEKIGFPILFFLVFLGAWAQLFLVQADIPFTTQRWRSAIVVERRSMVHDLTAHHKLIGLTVRDAEQLLGAPDENADPWYRLSKHPDSRCLAYDLGIGRFALLKKYGRCLALYYGKDETIQDWELTQYKFW